MTLKQKAWQACSRWKRLKDAIEYSKSICFTDSWDELLVKCCTCSAVKVWRFMDCGHFVSRGSGGNSGVYFESTNIHAQCKLCNGFKQGAPAEYEQFIIEKYGQDEVARLRFQHRVVNKQNHVALEAYYKQEFEKLKRSVL